MICLWVLIGLRSWTQSSLWGFAVLFIRIAAMITILTKMTYFLVSIVLWLLAQRPITLILMMINSYSYSTNDLMFIKFQIFNQDFSQCLVSTKDSKSSFEANTYGSRARASRLHQVLKRSLAHGSILDQVKMVKKIFNRRFSRRFESMFISVRF